MSSSERKRGRYASRPQGSSAQVKDRRERLFVTHHQRDFGADLPLLGIARGRQLLRLERAQLTFEPSGLELRSPIARGDGAWLAFGFDERLDAAADQALQTMLDLMERELGVDRNHATALASVAVDLAVTQIVNDVKGVHAILRDGSIR